MPLLSHQYPFSCTPSVLAEIEGALSPERLKRYLRKEPEADHHRAFRLYLWNLQLCEAIYGPLQFAEVSIRNGLQRAMEAHFKKADWYTSGGFRTLLSQNLKDELDRVSSKAKGDHGSKLTPNHIVAGLSFGFWSHLLTVNFEKSDVWPKQFRTAFPHRKPGLQRERIHYRIETLRDFRNRVAHHMAIFDQPIKQVHETILEVTGWCSSHARWIIEETSRVEDVLGSPPSV
jgi:hypothetical protein